MWRCVLRRLGTHLPSVSLPSNNQPGSLLPNRSLTRLQARNSHSRGMASEPATLPPAAAITWKDDIFGGAIVDPDSGPSDTQSYSEALSQALGGWRLQGKRGIWLKLPKDRAHLIQCAVQQGFDFHHAEPGYVMLTAWLPPDEPCMLPPNASHQVGVGALVINARGEMLVVQERNGPLKGRAVWKMPTGLVHAGEDVTQAAVREVLEETGIRCRLDCVLLLRQAHGFAFGKSDMFVLVALQPEPGQGDATPQPQEEEIEAAAWLPLEQYTRQDTFQAELYMQMSEVCVAYAEGRHQGMQAATLQGSLPFSTRKRQDLLIWGAVKARAGASLAADKGEDTTATPASAL